MSGSVSPLGDNATVSGGPFDGTDAEAWARYHFLPHAVPGIVGIAVAVVLGIWEYCAFFPAEVVLWQRIIRRGEPSRTSFAWTTLVLRYLMLCFSVATAFISWSTSMKTDAACRATGIVTFASWCALVIVSAFAIAWRALAVAGGFLQNQSTVRHLVLLRLLQLFIATLVVCQVTIAVFTSVWLGMRQHSFWPRTVFGQCDVKPPPAFGSVDLEHSLASSEYYQDPLLWYWVFMIIFNLACLLIVLVALHTLATHSRGYSKFINGMRNHSLFYFTVVLLLSILSIVWRKAQNAGWLMYPTTVVQAAVMIRVLLAEQNAARRPVDTTYMDQQFASRHQFSTRGRMNTHGINIGGGAEGAQAQGAFIRSRGHDATVQFADQIQSDGAFASGIAAPSSAVLMHRPIYQPYSMMDNLGQAFSQVDSHNPRDLEGQSYEQSNGSQDSLDLPPNMYPGVIAMEERERRILLSKLEKDEQCSSGGGGEGGLQVCEQSHGGRLGPATSEKDSSDSYEQKVEETPGVDGAKLSDDAGERRRLCRVRRGNSFSALDDDRNGTDDEDDDEGVGIQTVHF